MRCVALLVPFVVRQRGRQVRAAGQSCQKEGSRGYEGEAANVPPATGLSAGDEEPINCSR